MTRSVSPGAALLAISFLAPAGQARAQFSPCSTEPNIPSAGIRYVCTSTSSHTTSHPDGTRLATNAWRTRITARRDGESDLFDVTVDSLAPPLDDPSVQATIQEATRLVAPIGFSAGAPVLVSSSVAAVAAMPLSNVTIRATTATQLSFSSSATTQALCVGDLGDLSRPPPPLPEPPACGPGSWKVELRAVDDSTAPPISDRLDDTHTHSQADDYSAPLVTGDLTTSHYVIVAEAVRPCVASPIRSPWWPDLITGTRYDCVSTSHHTVQHDSTALLGADAWSTRITGRFPGGPPFFDVTLNSSVSPALDDGVSAAFEGAVRAVRGAAGSAVSVTGPILISSALQPVVEAFLPGAVNVLELESTLSSYSVADRQTTVCVGDLGDLPRPPASLPSGPCSPGSRPILLRVDEGFSYHYYDVVVSTHTHTQRDVYAGLYVTGTLTTSHYDFVADTASSTLVVPIVLSTTGGSAFTSELTLTNSGTTDAQITYEYTPAFGGDRGTAAETLAAGRQRVIPDAVAYLESLGLTNPGSGGTLRITFTGLSSVDAASALVRTTAAVPEGRVGLAYPALLPSKVLSSPVYLPGLRQNSFDRSNVAVLNAGALGDGDITLRLTVFSGDPADPISRVLPDVTLSPGGFVQVSSILVSNGLSLSNGYVRVERVSGTAPFYAYAVVNDQATSDGSFIEPVEAGSSSPNPATTLPALVETATYATELVLTNLSASPRTLNFTWVASALTGGKATFAISLLPGEQQILPAFVQLLRDRGAVTDSRGPSFAGALFVSDTSGDLRGVSISARVLSALGGGRAGVYVSSFPTGSEAAKTAWLFGLQQNAETRSNLAIVNVGGVDSSASDFRIDIFDGASGLKVGSLVATVPAKGFTQVDRALAIYAPNTSTGWALVTKTSGSNPFLAYAVLNDGALPGLRSGDGAFVAAVPPVP